MKIQHFSVNVYPFFFLIFQKVTLYENNCQQRIIIWIWQHLFRHTFLRQSTFFSKSPFHISRIFSKNNNSKYYHSFFQTWYVFLYNFSIMVVNWKNVRNKNISQFMIWYLNKDNANYTKYLKLIFRLDVECLFVEVAEKF